MLNSGTELPDCSSGPMEVPFYNNLRGFDLPKLLQRGKRTMFCVIFNVDPDLAEEMLTVNTRNGPVSRSNLDRYARIMSEGRWELSPQGIAFSRDGALLDGQHRIMAIIKSGVSVPLVIWFGWDFDKTFGITDKGRKRSAAYDLTIQKDADGNTKYPNAVSFKALAHLVSVVDGVKLYDEQAKVAHAQTLNFELAQEAIKAAKSKYAQKLAATSTLALAYYRISTTTTKRRMFDEFWERLMTSQGAGPKLISFRDDLMTEKPTQRASYPQQIMTSGRIIEAWNFYAQNKSRKPAWSDTTTVPEAI